MCRRRNGIRHWILLGLLLAASPASAGKFGLLPALPGGALAKAVQLDAAGNIFAAGSLAPRNPRSAADATDAFVAKLAPDGSSVVYFTVLAGSGADAASALALGADGSATVAGSTTSGDFPVTPGAWQTAPVQATQAFVARLDPGGTVQYATYLDTLALAIALDSTGDVFVSGSGGPAGTPLIAGGNAGDAAYVVKLDPTLGKNLVSFAGLGGSHIAVDPGGYIYLTGVYPVGVTLQATAGALQMSVPFTVCGGDN
jgi:hypothetical protein